MTSGPASTTGAPADDTDGLTCFRRLLKVAGYAFGILTVAINIADVATDVVVAVQFHAAGHTTWFWLVVTSLIIAHCVYTFIGAFVLPDQPVYSSWRDVPWTLRLFLSLIFAQLIPIINLAVELVSGGHDDDSGSDDYDLDPVVTNTNRTVTTQAAREELEGVRKSQVLQSRMAAALEEHMRKYGLFYVESAVEAAPQAIIQLLAITFLGQASPAQLVSLCCSLFSITSKAFVIAQAYDARVMAFKFALAAHDVFSTFYLFSTLVAQETAKDASFFGLEVSWLGYVWLWKMVVYGCLGVISGLIAVIVHCHEESGIERFYGLGAYLAGLCLAGPIALVLETLKLTGLNLHLSSVEPRRNAWAFYGLLLSFLDGDGIGDGKPRLRHYCEFVVRLRESRQRHFEMLPKRTRRVFRQSARDMEERYVLLHTVDGQPPPQRPRVSPRELYKINSVGPAYGALLEHATSDAPFDEWTAYRCRRWTHDYDPQVGRVVLRPPPADDNYGSGNPCSGHRAHEVAAGIWMGIVGVSYALGQLFSFAYPFANAAQNFHSHNILQATCFYATCAALFVVVVLLPVTYRYWRLNVALAWFANEMFGEPSQQLKMISEYHAPPHIGCLQEVVPVEVMPAEVTAICGRFLSPRDVGLGKLSIAECAALKRRIAHRGAVDVELAPEPAAGTFAHMAAPSATSSSSSSDSDGNGDGDIARAAPWRTAQRRQKHRRDARRRRPVPVAAAPAPSGGPSPRRPSVHHGSDDGAAAAHAPDTFGREHTGRDPYDSDSE